MLFAQTSKKKCFFFLAMNTSFCYRHVNAFLSFIHTEAFSHSACGKWIENFHIFRGWYLQYCFCFITKLAAVVQSYEYLFIGKTVQFIRQMKMVETDVQFCSFPMKNAIKNPGIEFEANIMLNYIRWVLLSLPKISFSYIYQTFWLLIFSDGWSLL